MRQDQSLARLCGFDRFHNLPDAATISRVYAGFARLELPQRVHAVLIHNHLGDQLIGHLSRNNTTIEAWERPKEPTRIERQLNMATLSERAGRRGSTVKS